MRRGCGPAKSLHWPGSRCRCLPVEHHYLVTETIPEIEAMGHELPTIVESEAGYYSRQEGQGYLLGAYEKHLPSLGL